LTTRFTAALETQLQSIGLDPVIFSSSFDSWKALGEAGEYQDSRFGKDGAYVSPEVGGERYKLRHVHLPPLADPLALRIWMARWKRRARKSSNRVLVYVSDPVHGHLLIYILTEPDAHEIALMKTAKHRQIMLNFAAIAERFIQDGTIIA
jgi:mRNA interferase YafO